MTQPFSTQVFTEKNVYAPTKIFSQLLIVTLFLTAKIGNNHKTLSIDKWVNK